MSETHEQSAVTLPRSAASESQQEAAGDVHQASVGSAAGTGPDAGVESNASTGTSARPSTPAAKKAAGKTTPGTNSTAKKTTASPTASRVLLLIFNLILLGGIAGLGFLYWEQQKALDLLFTEYNSATAQQNSFTQALNYLESTQADQLSVLQEQVTSAAQQLALQTSELESINRELVNTRLKISQQAGEVDGSWMLSEAQSLLRLARQRLLNARDLNTALSLMLSADDVLKQINDPAVQSVRAILLNDMDALRSVRQPDIQAMHQRLGSLVPQLEELSLLAESGRAKVFSAPESTAVNTGGWFDELKQSLSQYFVISRDGAPAMPQASPEQFLLTRQLARLQLEQARIALLQGDAQVYRATLDQLISVVDGYMQGDAKAALLQTLGRLRDTPVTATIPASGNALNALRQITPVQADGRVMQ